MDDFRFCPAEDVPTACVSAVAGGLGDEVVDEAETAYGIIGIKVWIFKGEIMEHDPAARDRRQQELQDSGGPRPQRRDR